MSKTERLGHANALIQAISRHGRRFFYSPTSGATGRLELDGRGRLWWIDEYRGARVYVAYSGRWRGFSHGGTLRGLIQGLHDYIQRGALLHPDYIATPRMSDGSDIWGYGAEAGAAVRAEAHQLPMFAQLAQAQQGTTP